MKYLRFSWWSMALRARFNEAFAQLSFRPKTIDREVEGERFKFYIGDATGQSWYNKRDTSNVEMRFIRELLVNGKKCITVLGMRGASWV